MLKIILISIAVGILISAILGLLLAIADKFFAVKEDNRIEVVTRLLPNANCGACGYPGCQGLAKALIEQKVTKVSTCSVSSPDQVAEIVTYINETPGPDDKFITVTK